MAFSFIPVILSNFDLLFSPIVMLLLLLLPPPRYLTFIVVISYCLFVCSFVFFFFAHFTTFIFCFVPPFFRVLGVSSLIYFNWCTFFLQFSCRAASSVVQPEKDVLPFFLQKKRECARLFHAFVVYLSVCCVALRPWSVCFTVCVPLFLPFFLLLLHKYTKQH